MIGVGIPGAMNELVERGGPLLTPTATHRPDARVVGCDVEITKITTNCWYYS